MMLDYPPSHRRPRAGRALLRASLLGVSASLLALAGSAGCGGKAVVDPQPEACECDEATSCPAGDDCGANVCEQCRCVLAPDPEGSSCSDGFCDGAGACFTRAQICARACQYIPPCMTSTPDECYSFCFHDLSDCSSAQMYDTDRCTSETLTPVCHAELWMDCITPISCLETD